MALILLTGTACDSADGSAQETIEKRKTFRGAGLTFRYPASWVVTPPSVDLAADPNRPWGGGNIGSLSSEDQLRLCVQSGADSSISCNPEKLGHNALVLTWNLFTGLPAEFAVDTRPLFAGERRTVIGGSPAVRRRVRNIACSGGPERDGEIVDASFDKPGAAPGEFYGMTACIRGPRFKPLERQVDAMLDSVRFRS
jgi:hypothetical protein